MARALSLLSGGLDSILAALIIKEQGIDITGLAFNSLFFDAKKAKKGAKNAKIPLITQDISKKHLQIVKNPKHGYGKRMNPCIDCHLLMLKEAKKVMWAKGPLWSKGPSSLGRSPGRDFDFIITGDVLGQRGFSQNKQALKLIEKSAGLEGLILRPLSAKLLDETIPEKKGWIDRDKLFAIQGKSRKKQLKLAKKYGLKSFSSPGTSCVLTDPNFSKRLKRMLANNNSKADENDIQLLRLGRHFWHEFPRSRSGSRRINSATTKNVVANFNSRYSLIVVGRNEEENKKLENLARIGDILMDIKNHPSPIALIRFPVIANFNSRSSQTGKPRLAGRQFQRRLKSATTKLALNRAKQLLSRYAHIKKDLEDKEFVVKKT